VAAVKEVDGMGVFVRSENPHRFFLNRVALERRIPNAWRVAKPDSAIVKNT
jgi:hypothetical protein